MNPHSRMCVPWTLAALTFCVFVFGLPRPAAPQADEALYRPHKDHKMIGVQVRLALPSAQRGLALLSAATDAQSMGTAYAAIYDSYRLLRAAHQGADEVLNFTAFPDPLLSMERDRIWGVRVHLLHCLDRKPKLLALEADEVAYCSRNLTEGIQKLRILVAIVP